MPLTVEHLLQYILLVNQMVTKAKTTCLTMWFFGAARLRGKASSRPHRVIWLLLVCYS